MLRLRAGGIAFADAKVHGDALRILSRPMDFKIHLSELFR